MIVLVKCDVHEDPGRERMLLVVTPERATALAAAQGAVLFKGLPPGGYEPLIWHMEYRQWAGRPGLNSDRTLSFKMEKKE